MADLTPAELTGLFTALHVIARLLESFGRQIVGLFRKKIAEDKADKADDAKWSRINMNTEILRTHEREDAAIHTELRTKVSRIEDDVKEIKQDIKTLLRRSTGRQ